MFQLAGFLLVQECCMAQGLPVRFSNVHYYRVAGKYVYAGDLFIARNNLYFFPEVDMEKQREDLARHMPHDIALLLTVILYVGQRVRAYPSRTEFWKKGLSDEQFRKEAASYIESLKVERQMRRHEFGTMLPLPLHVRTDEISGMSLSALGRLSFSAQSDTHDLNIGVLRKKRLQNVLWEAGVRPMSY
jgi:hypothetical protein